MLDDSNRRLRLTWRRRIDTPAGGDTAGGIVDDAEVTVDLHRGLQ